MAFLDTLMAPGAFALSLFIAFVAGLVKGLVGFAMPMLLISGLSSFLAPELALAGLILPTLVTNGWQALQQGPRAAWESIRRFRVFLLVGAGALMVSAQLVGFLTPETMLLIIGVPVTAFALIQLLGFALVLARQSAAVEATVGAVAGFLGGLSGVWGPPTVMFLTALGTEKVEQMRVQGVIYGLGAVLLLAAHVPSGVLSMQTAPFSLALVVPAVFGMWLGGRFLDRVNQRQFRQATLLVLLIAGLNLVRRGVMGA